MAMVLNVSSAFHLNISSSLLPSSSSSFPSSSAFTSSKIPSSDSFPIASLLPSPRKRRALLFPSVSLNNQPGEAIDSAHEEEEVEVEPSETLLYAFTPLPLLFVAALPGAGTSLFGPFVELVKSWSLPDWLVHWGHPGDMNPDPDLTILRSYDPFEYNRSGSYEKLLIGRIFRS
ncbi:hypothetical protein TEA_013312 [Camellia sinensis var. sinensis]|uniref:Uncharacterized protein n=1 Tax=Camellia sinensis var. sinensis TaxID=542762 RepID=A0A4S4DRA3_CAMSN|nr:hypothetical protein TEA_013312 [Camellia sinensis var. sinensis]